MKRTDQERIDREFRRTQKKARLDEKRAEKKEASVGGYARALLDIFAFDETHIFNTSDDEDVLEVILEMKEALPEKQWEPTLRKAIRMTKVEEKQSAFEELRLLLED